MSNNYKRGNVNLTGILVSKYNKANLSNERWLFVNNKSLRLILDKEQEEVLSGHCGELISLEGYWFGKKFFVEDFFIISDDVLLNGDALDCIDTEYLKHKIHTKGYIGVSA